MANPVYNPNAINMGALSLGVGLDGSVFNSPPAMSESSINIGGDLLSGGANPWAAPPATEGTGFLSGLKGFSDKMGTTPYTLATGALQGVGGAMSAYNGYQQTKLAKKQFNFQKDAWNAQYNAQKNLVNSQMEDRQKQRAMRNPNALRPEEYLAKYGIK